MSTMTRGVCSDGDVTYEKITASERNPALRVPFLTIQEIEGVLEDGLFHTRVEDDGSEGTFRTRRDETPFVPCVGRVDRNLLLPCLFPAFPSFSKEILSELVAAPEDTARTDQLAGKP